VVRTFDLDREFPAVRRDPWMQIRAWRQRERFRFPGSIDPHQDPLAALNHSGDIGQIAARRHIEVGHTRIPAHEHTVERGERLARHFEPRGIETNGKYFTSPCIEQMTGRRIARMRTAFYEHFPAPSLRREDSYLRVIE
jgi:hypothetical protein